MQFLYIGFSQRENIRCYRFQGVVPRERPTKVRKNIEFRLSADMSLLSGYQVRIQDLPGLCLQIIGTTLVPEGENGTPLVSYAITREDLSAFASARNAIEESKSARRKSHHRFKPSPSSQLKWPQTK